MEQSQLRALLQEFSLVSQTTPGRNTFAEREIYVGETPPTRMTAQLPQEFLTVIVRGKGCNEVEGPISYVVTD